MTDLILQIGASKLAISVVLAVGILALTRRVGRPALSHALWLLLLGALLVPPVVSIPLFPPQASPPAVVPVAGFLEAGPKVPANSTLLDWLKAYGPSGLIWLWFLGTASILGWTLVRALRFHGSLVRASAAAPVSVQRMARRISGKLGLKAVPAIHATYTQLSPMVWWAGGKVRVLLPFTLIAEMDAAELRCVLAHELAHIRRRDHLVRWLEWLACTAFWWNPVAWWARRKLRAAEELCCDALALASSHVSPRAYARSLLRAIDLVSDRPSATAPAFASTAHGRERLHSLEQRFKMIVSDTPSPSLPTRLRTVFRFGAVGLLAAGLIYCSDQEIPVEPETASSMSAANLTASVADVDGDGAADLLVRAHAFLNDGTGRFVSRTGEMPEQDLEAGVQLYADTLVFSGGWPGPVASLALDDVVSPGLASRITPLLGESETDLVMFSDQNEMGERYIATVDIAGLREQLGGDLQGTAPPLDALRGFVQVESSSTLDGLRCRGNMFFFADVDGTGSGALTLEGSCERVGEDTDGTVTSSRVGRKR